MRIASCVRSRAVRLSESGDCGMMSMAMLVVIVGLGLGALMVPIVVAQNRSTTHTDSRVQALHDAESGLNAMLGRLRAATTDGGASGSASMLKCYDTAGPLKWQDTVTDGYSVVVDYLASDPLVKAGPPLTCSAGAGPSEIPGFARIRSTGTSKAGGVALSRTLESTYVFKTTNTFTYNDLNTTTTGGPIRVNPRGFFLEDETQCLTATGVIFEAGMPLSVQACPITTSPPTPTPANQLFSYNSDLSLRLVQSITVALPTGLCVSASGAGAVTLEPCVSPAAATNQRWNLTANAAFAGTNLVSAPVCLAVRPSGVDIVGNPCQVNYDPAGSWLPTPSVGAGAAGAASSQLVNFSQFGRCVQLSDPSAPSTGTNPVILYPCVQANPYPASGSYQQLSYVPSSGHWETNLGSPKYCLTSQGVADRLVTVEVCGASDSQKWTDYGAALVNQGKAGQWGYRDRYTIVDSTGLCLALNPAADPNAAPASDPNAAFVFPSTAVQYDPKYSPQYNKITSDTCDGTPPQKWNAGQPAQSSTVKNTREN
ncbi:MAG: hypothetical protein ABI775_00800 [Pseudonocardiales bacterium]